MAAPEVRRARLPEERPEACRERTPAAEGEAPREHLVPSGDGDIEQGWAEERERERKERTHMKVGRERTHEAAKHV